MSSGGHNEAKFKAAIISLSNSELWDEAKAEWRLHFVYDDPTDRSCECDHSPIHQICVIQNRKNSNITEVGNVCVRRFLRLLSNRIFAVIRRVRGEIRNSLNPKALELFRERGVISSTEEAEYNEYWRKRTTLTEAQWAQKLDINRRVLSYVDTETKRLIERASALGLKLRAA